MRFSMECKVGRLVEVRILEFATDDQPHLGRLAAAVIGQVQRRVVICSDCRKLKLMAPAAAEALSALFAQTNPKIERSAIITGSHPTAALQLSRVVREADLDVRRAFPKRHAAETWLREVLDGREISRLTAFLDQNEAEVE
jgi:hypothetical protein